MTTCVTGLHGAGVSTAISTSMAADTVSISTGNGPDLAVETDRGVLGLIGTESSLGHDGGRGFSVSLLHCTFSPSVLVSECWFD